MDAHLVHHNPLNTHPRSLRADPKPPASPSKIKTSDQMPLKRRRNPLIALLIMVLIGGVGSYFLFFSSAETLVSNSPNTVVMQYIVPNTDGPSSDTQLSPDKQQPFTLYGNGLLVCGHSYLDQFSAPRNSADDPNAQQPTARLLSVAEVNDLAQQVISSGFNKLAPLNYTYGMVSDNEHVIRLVLNSGEKDVLYYNDGTAPTAYVQTLHIMQSACTKATTTYVSQAVTMQVLADAQAPEVAPDDSATDTSDTAVGGLIYDSNDQALAATTTAPAKTSTPTPTTTTKAAQPSTTAVAIPKTPVAKPAQTGLNTQLTTSAAGNQLRNALQQSNTITQQNKTLIAQKQQVVADNDVSTSLSGKAATDLQQKLGTKPTQLVTNTDGKMYQIAVAPVLPKVNNPLQLNRDKLAAQAKASKVSMVKRVLSAFNSKADAYAVNNARAVRIVILVPRGVSTSVVSSATKASLNYRGAAVASWYKNTVGRPYKYDGVSVMQGSLYKSGYDTCPRQGICRGRIDAVLYNVASHDQGTINRDDKVTVVVPYWNLYSLRVNLCGLAYQSGNVSVVPIIGVPDVGYGGRYCNITQSLGHEMGHNFGFSHVGGCESRSLMVGSPYCFHSAPCSLTGRYYPSCTLTRGEASELHSDFSDFPVPGRVVVISGRVYDAKTNKGYPNIPISTCTRDKLGNGADGYTDANGNWSLSVTAGTVFCVDVPPFVLNKGYRPIHNQPEHATAVHYGAQVAGANFYHRGSKNSPFYSWDRAADTRFDFSNTVQSKPGKPPTPPHKPAPPAGPKWRGWKSLHTKVAGDVYALKLPTGSDDIFQCANGKVYHKSRVKGHTWSDWMLLNGGAACTKNIGVVAGAKNEQVFTVAPNGMIMHTWRWYGPNQWHRWVVWNRPGDGLHPGASISALSSDSGSRTTELFTVEKEHVYRRYYGGTQWSSWQPILLSSSNGNGVAVVSRPGSPPVRNILTANSNGEVILSGVGHGRQTWNPWADLYSGHTIGVPTATAPDAKTIIAFARGDNGQVKTIRYNAATGWPKTWSILPGLEATNTPSVASANAKLILVYVRGPDGTLYQNNLY